MKSIYYDRQKALMINLKMLPDEIDQYFIFTGWLSEINISFNASAFVSSLIIRMDLCIPNIIH